MNRGRKNEKSFYLNDSDEYLDSYEEEHGDGLFGSLKQLYVTADVIEILKPVYNFKAN